MEKVKSRSHLFVFLFSCFLLILMFSFYFESSKIPSLPDFLSAVFDPLTTLQDPLSDVTNAFQDIVNWINGGGLPSVQSLLDLLTAPFRILANGIGALAAILLNLLSIFKS